MIASSVSAGSTSTTAAAYAAFSAAVSPGVSEPGVGVSSRRASRSSVSGQPAPMVRTTNASRPRRVTTVEVPNGHHEGAAPPLSEADKQSVKPPLPEGRGFLGVKMKPLSKALAGLPCYNILGLVIPDQDLRTIHSKASSLGIWPKPHPLADWYP